MTYLLDPYFLARVGHFSALLGAFILGPLSSALLYMYMYSGKMGDRLDCGSVKWYIGYDYRNGCAVDIAERVRCGGEAASCYKLDRGRYGGKMLGCP